MRLKRWLCPPQVVFFGCAEDSAPTIVYIPNQEVSFPSNVSTFKFSYTDEEVQVLAMSCAETCGCPHAFLYCAVWMKHRAIWAQGMLDNGFRAVAGNPRAPKAPLAIGCLLVATAGQRCECRSWMKPLELHGLRKAFIAGIPFGSVSI